MASFELVEPESLDEALAMLDPDDPEVRPFGGGTALMLMIKAQLFRPRRLVCLRRADDALRTISISDGLVRIGAMTTFSRLDRSSAIAEHFPAVRRAMLTLANARVRNVATVGGNLAHGDPHLDLPPLWAALRGRATLLSRTGRRQLAVEEIGVGYNETNIANDEIISHLDVPIQPDWVSTYVKVTTRAAHDWPALGLAIALRRQENGAIADLRLFLGAAVDKITRLLRAEDELRGRYPDNAVMSRAGEAAVGEVEMESDGRGSRTYKNQLLRVFLARGIQQLVGVTA